MKQSLVETKELGTETHTNCQRLLVPGSSPPQSRRHQHSSPLNTHSLELYNSCTWVAGSLILRPSSFCLPRHMNRKLDQKQRSRDQTQHSIWDADVVGRSFTGSATTLTLASVFNSQEKCFPFYAQAVLAPTNASSP